jgi:uncharacterized protein DUF4136
MRKYRIFLFAFFTLVACSTSKVVHTDLAEGVQLSSYRTFDFYKLDASGDTIPGNFTERSAIMQQAIATELESRGFVRSSTNPDLLVNIGIVVKEEVQTRETNFAQDAQRYTGQRRYTWKSETVEVEHYRVGTATVHLVDAKQNKLIWQGTVQNIIPNKEKKVEESIKKGIADLFSRFPVAALR